MFSAIMGWYSVEKWNSSVRNVYYSNEHCYVRSIVNILFWCFVLLPLMLLPWFGFIFNWAEAPLDIHIPSRSHWELPGRIKLPVLAATQSCPIQISKGGVMQAQCSLWTTTINICPVHIPSQKNLELVLLFLLPLNQVDLLLPFLCPPQPPFTLSLHCRLVILSSPLPLILISEVFPFNWLCFYSFFFLLFWPVCLAFLLLHQSLPLFASQMLPLGSSPRPSSSSTGLLPRRMHTKLLDIGEKWIVWP